MTAFVTLAVLNADEFGCFMIVQFYLLGPCLMPLCHTVPCGWGFGRAQMLKVHIPRHGVETIQESEELEHAMTGLKTLGTLKRERWRDSNMSRPQWKCNWATHAMDMPRRMSKSLSELGCQVLDLYRCFIMRKIQLYWRITPFDRNTLIETFLNFLVAQNQNQVYGKSHGKSVNMLAINNHVKLTKECLLPEDLAGFLPPLPRNLGRWSKVLVVNVVLTFVFSLLAYSSMAIH